MDDTLRSVLADLPRIIRSRYRHATDDMVQDACEGAVRAMVTFDPSNGGRLAPWLISKAIWHMLDVGRQQRHARIKRRVEWVPLDAVPEFGDEDQGYAFAEASVDGAHIRAALRVAAAGTSARNRDIVAAVAQGDRLAAVGRRYGITEARCCQIMQVYRSRLLSGLAA